MTKIKIVGGLIFFISILLLFLFSYINTQNRHYDNLIKTINEQKAFTQEISKNIFYISKHKDSSAKQLDTSIQSFLQNMEARDETLQEIDSSEVKRHSAKIIALWNEFYILVQNFKDQKKVTTSYSNILLEKTVVEIYNQNLKLVVEFDKLLRVSKEYTLSKSTLFKNIQYILFTLLSSMLLYLFFQLQSVLDFINKFRKTSQNIIQSSSVQELEPITIDASTSDISEASENFNQLVSNINESVKHSSQSLNHSYKSLEIVEEKIENLMELIYTMQESNHIDDTFTKKEDILIQALEELTSSAHNLKNLEEALQTLLSNSNK